VKRTLTAAAFCSGSEMRRRRRKPTPSKRTPTATTSVNKIYRAPRYDAASRSISRASRKTALKSPIPIRTHPHILHALGRRIVTVCLLSSLMVLPCNRLGANPGRVRYACCYRTPPRPTWSATSRPMAVVAAVSLEGNGPLRCARLHHEPAWRRSHQEPSARPPAAYSSYYPGHSFRIPSSPTRLANIAECFAFFPKLWGPLFRSETLHDRQDSHRGRLAPARRPRGADPKHLRAVNGLGMAAKPYICNSFKLRIVRRTTR